MKKIAIMTSGGDAPGMNMCLYTLYRHAIKKGYEVFFIEDAFKGLCEDKIFQIKNTKESLKEFKRLSNRGGTFLGSVRFKEFYDPKYQEIAANNLKSKGINNLVVLGGNGSFKGALYLSMYGINVQGIPVTIDNDLYYSDYSIGFMTAVNTIINSVEQIKDTMKSHHRLCLIETMGNKCGELPMYAGVLSNSDVIFIPEIFSDYPTLLKTIKNKSKDREINIVLVSESICHVDEIAEKLKKDIDIDFRTMNLGHLQRGGEPVEFDKKLAISFAKQALYNIECAIYNKAICINDNQIYSIPLEDVEKYTTHEQCLEYQHYLKCTKYIDGIEI